MQPQQSRSQASGKKFERHNYQVIALVTVITVFADLAIAVLVGVIVSALVFAWESAIRIRARKSIDEKGITLEMSSLGTIMEKINEIIDYVNESKKEKPGLLDAELYMLHKKMNEDHAVDLIDYSYGFMIIEEKPTKTELQGFSEWLRKNQEKSESDMEYAIMNLVHKLIEKYKKESE